MTTQPKRLTAEQEANAIDHKAKTSGQHPDVLEMDIAAALRKRDELYAKAWEECEEWRRLAGHRAANGEMRYRFPSGEYEDVPEADDHDAARKAAGLEDA